MLGLKLKVAPGEIMLDNGYTMMEQWTDKY